MGIRIDRLLRRAGLLQADLLASTREAHPEVSELKPGELVVVEDAGITKWACLTCPGGCGASISLPLNPMRRPRWRVRTDSRSRPTVEPSVHQTNDCGCHFWIRKGMVEWCRGGQPTFVANVRPDQAPVLTRLKRLTSWVGKRR